MSLLINLNFIQKLVSLTLDVVLGLLTDLPISFRRTHSTSFPGGKERVPCSWMDSRGSLLLTPTLCIIKAKISELEEGQIIFLLLVHVQM